MKKQKTKRPISSYFALVCFFLLTFPIPLLAQEFLYFPNITSDGTWETEICVINTSADSSLSGELIAYNNSGQELSSTSLTLPSNARREFTIGDEFPNPSNIGYIIFESDSQSVVGYTKLYIDGKYCVAVPAASDINTGDIYVSHIASNTNWWTQICIVNTTSSSKQITFEFDNGSTATKTIAAKEHQAFNISSLFGGTIQPGVKSAVIKNGNGIVGLELFGSSDSSGNNCLSGVLLSDDTTTNIYYPHVTRNSKWWTGLVAYNPSIASCNLTITPYTADGISLSSQILPLNGQEKYIGTASALNFPPGTAWFKINSTRPISGFELFGTMDKFQMGGYTGVGISGTDGVFAKTEKNGGWTGIAFVNIEDSSATVTMSAYDDGGNVIATETIDLNAHEKIVALALNLFSQDISSSTYISYSSTGNVVGFQLNGSSDDMMLDALPGVSSGGGGGDETDALFAPDHLIQVEIEMAESDWDDLRVQGRSMPHTMTVCRDRDFEYDYFPATVTIDGRRMENVAVRKKGFIGSLSVIRPSLKLHFAKYPEVDGRTYSGMKRMTLNNDRQDPSHTHQSMSYALFRKAGLAAPRCNHAQVRVNGTDLGFYSNIEPIKKPFLARRFASDDGNLYEVDPPADFSPVFVANYERKTNELDADGLPAPRDDLNAVTEALSTADAQLYDALDQVIDMDEYLSFWAMEVITGHWDSHTGNRNNHYIYNDPTTGKFHFIPWGTDGAFSDVHAFLPFVPKSVYASSAIANRLYAYPETRKKYRERLQQLINTVWNTNNLLTEVNRIGKLTGAGAEALQKQRDFISSRKQQIQAELDDTAPEWPYPAITELPPCTDPIPVSGTFRAVWGDDPFAFVPSPTSTLNLNLNGSKLTFQMILTAAGYDREQDPNGIPSVNYVGMPTGATPIIISLRTTPEQMTIGEVPFHGMETFGVVARVPAGTDSQPVMLGFIGGGSIVFTSVGTNNGDVIEGSFSGLLRPRGGGAEGFNF